MNLNDIESAAKHIRETCKCMQCEAKFKKADIHFVAATNIEGLFELRCTKCYSTTIVTVTNSTEPEITDQQLPQETLPTLSRHKTVTQNDILDIKNFLTNFDGNFKKIFQNK